MTFLSKKPCSWGKYWMMVCSGGQAAKRPPIPHAWSDGRVKPSHKGALLLKSNLTDGNFSF